MSLGHCLTVVFLVFTASCSAKDLATFNQLQELLRLRRDVLGESSYECYGAGECIATYTRDGLMTYKEEALCTRSEAGCGEDLLERARREQKCKRDVGSLEECSFLLERAKRRETREVCVELQRRFQVVCGVGQRKRGISEACGVVMEEMEGCAGEALEKRGAVKTCPEGWSMFNSKEICYKYFHDPQTFNQASTTCKTLKGHLATLEKMLFGADSEFYDFLDELIKSSGAMAKIDAVLSTMDDRFGGENWKESISYYDNWGWIGVRKIDGVWKWITDKKLVDLNHVKIGHADWRSNEPSTDNHITMDNGDCVVYFHYIKDLAESDTLQTIADRGSWWNVDCKLELPFVCEVKAT